MARMAEKTSPFDYAGEHWGGNRGTSTLGSGLLNLPARQGMSGDWGDTGVEQQKPLPVVCKEVKLDCGYRLDLVVEDGR